MPDSTLIHRLSRILRQLTLKLRRQFITLTVYILSKCAGGPFSFVPNFLFTVLRRTWIEPTRLEALHKYVYGHLEGKATKREITHLAQLSSWKTKKGLPDINLTKKELSRHQRVHLIIEPGAPIPANIEHWPQHNQTYIIHAFSDFTDIVSAFRNPEKFELRPLRDQFNDMSKDGEQLFKFSQTIANNIIDQISRDDTKVLDLDSLTLQICASQTLEDQLSHKLSMAMCMKRAMQQINQKDAIIYIASSPNYILDGFELFSELIATDNFFLASSPIGTLSTTEFWERIRSKSQNKTILKDRIYSLEVNEVASKVRSFLNRKRKQIAEYSEIEAILLSNKINASHPLFLIATGKATAHLEALNIFSDYVEKHSGADPNYHPVRIFTSFLAAEDKQKVNDASQKKTKSITYNFKQYKQLIADAPEALGKFDKYVQVLITRLSPILKFDESSLNDFFFSEISKFIRIQLLWVLIRYHFGFALGKRNQNAQLLSYPSRAPDVGCVSAGFQDAFKGQNRTFDIQSLNVPPHPKYRAPNSDRAVVMDETAFETYANFLNYPSNQMAIINSPRYDRLSEKYHNTRAQEAYRSFGLPSNIPLALFISQLQPMELMYEILKPICQAVSTNPDAHLIVRLHPRENRDREECYRRFAHLYLPPRQVSFSKDEDLIGILKICSCVVTWYSNVAKEAHAVGKTVFAPTYLEQKPPVDIAGQGVAKAISNPHQMKITLQKELSKQQTSPQPALPSSNAKKLMTYLRAHPPIIEHEDSDGNQLNVQDPKLWSFVLCSLPTGARMSVDHINWLHGEPTVYGDIKCNDFFGKNRTLNKVSLDAFNNPELTIEAAANKANILADRIIDSILLLLPKESELTQFFIDHRRAIWMRLRPGLIRAQKHEMSLLGGLHDVKKNICIIGSSIDDLRWAWKERQTMGVDASMTRALIIDPSGTTLSKTFSNIQEAESHAYDSPVEPFSIDEIKRVDSWLGRIKSKRSTFLPSSEILITTDWGLKTVPATLDTIIHGLTQGGCNVVIANHGTKGFNNLQSKYQPNQAVIDVFTAGNTASKISGLSKKTQDILISRFRSSLSDNVLEDLSPVLKSEIDKQLIQLVKTYLPQIATWKKFVDTFFQTGGKVSLACPGRQWQTEIAHRSAESNNALSMTIQNAYMTKGYTYFPPIADFIGVIDQWSKDSLVNDYGIQPEKIAVVSTPRFDVYSKCATKERSFSATEIPRILFATQPGYPDATIQIAKALSELIDENEIPELKCVIKAHPRSSSEELAVLEELTNQLKSDSISLTVEGTIKEQLDTANIVITMFSNVGIEAAIAKKNIIIVKPNGTPLPLPLDQMGIGVTVTDFGDISSVVKQFIFDSNTYNLQTNRLEKFAQANPAMVSGGSSKTIIEAIIQRCNQR